MIGQCLAAGLLALGLAWGQAALAQDAGTGSAGPSASAGPSVELAPGVTFEVVDLRRHPDKGIMELRFAVTNDSPADTTLQDHGLALSNAVSNIAIIDFAGKKQYNIGYAGDCLCSTFKDADGGLVRSGERREFWAWYALPPAGAKQVAIKLRDQRPITNVPLN